MRKLVFVLLAACASQKPAATAQPAAAPPASGALRAPAAFAQIGDRAERSRALFLEASRVFLHPRCANCHPDGDTPRSGADMHVHDPPVVRGPLDTGIPGMRCTGCHQDKNLELARIPGAPHWQLAPRKMAWVGKSPHAICEQMKDKSRNGNRSLQDVVDHNRLDDLVSWGWQPGHGREPAPGTQEQLGDLMQAWVDTGAECPPEGARP
ncbi:MAG TPA: Isoquinoline 1-oxidoreductase subunit [Myxococcales bacterium]